ncbi:MAG: MFS transporter [Thermodesulfobacteriota bacterium]|nr:MFS transporter [Thermodesulfobacteriota bacterium]
MNKDHKKIVRSWKLYDWANSAFATTIMAAVLPEFYSSVAGSTLDKTIATSYWGYSNTIAMLIIAITAPILGAIGDHSRAKKKFLAMFAVIGIFATALLTGITNGMWFYASLLYIFGRIGFAGGNIFYDSLLPHVAGPDEIDRVSAEGYAYGYLGGGILLSINLLMILKPSLFFIPDAQWGTRISFLTVALWWAVFSIPIFKNVSEPKVLILSDESSNPLLAGYQRIRNTLRDFSKFKDLVKFLVAFWLYNDGITTIIVMAVIFGAEIGIGTFHLIGAILMVQFLGIPFTLLFGRLPEKLGTKNSLLLSLGIYSIIVILGYFMQKPVHFWILAFLVSMVQGGSQALSRSMFGSMVPKGKSAEFFGFYDVSGKFSGIIGPSIFGIMGQLTGSSRLSIISIIIFFIAGAVLLAKVDHAQGIKAAATPDDESTVIG